MYYSVHNEEIIISGKPYKGFLNIYNVENPEIRTALDQSGANQKDDTAWWMPTLSWGDPQSRPLLSNSKFRVFVPPGALQINLIMFCGQNDPVKLAVRFGQPPESITGEPTQENSFFFDKFATQDVYLQNAGGHIDIYALSINRAPDPFTPAPPMFSGGWLYINVYDSPQGVQNIQYAMKVDKVVYSDWLQGYDKDIYGLKIGAEPDHPETEFERGVRYCKDNPQKCGVVSLDLSTLQIKINSLDITQGGKTQRFDLTLDNTQGLNWTIKPGGIVPLGD